MGCSDYIQSQWEKEQDRSFNEVLRIRDRLRPLPMAQIIANTSLEEFQLLNALFANPVSNRPSRAELETLLDIEKRIFLGEE